MPRRKGTKVASKADIDFQQGSSSTSRPKKARQPEISRRSRIHSQKYSKPKKNTISSRNVGKLSLFMDMPLDVIHEIAAKLHPLDLLQLSRVSKQFRSTFASKKSSRALWIASRRSLPGLPECPEELTEMQYASLLFEHSCMACGIGRAGKVDYGNRIRFCSPCWNQNVQFGVRAFKNHSPETQAVIPQVLPAIGGQYVEQENPDLFDDPVWEYTLEDEFYKPVAFDVIDELESFTPGSPEYTAFVEKRKEYVHRARKHGTAMYLWLEKLDHEKKDKAEEVSIERENAITAKLETLGYSTSDFPPNWTGDWYSLVHQPRPLTERIWKNILPKLEQAIENERKRRRIQAYARRVDMRRQELAQRIVELKSEISTSSLRYWMPLKHVMDIEDLAKMILGEDAQDELTAERFIPIAARLKEYGTEFEASVKKELIQQLKSVYKSEGVKDGDLEKDDMDDEILYRATSLFGCEFQKDLIEAWNFNTYGSYEEILEHLYTGTKRGSSWTAYRPCVWENGTALAIKILKNANAPPTALYKDVSEKLVCLCLKPSFSQPTSFSSLVEHVSSEINRYVKMAENLSLDRDQSLVLHNCHDLTPPDPLISFADKVDSLDYDHGEWLPDTTDVDFGGLVGIPCCGICQDLVDFKVQRYAQFAIVDSEEGKRDFVHHVRTCHQKEPSQDDVIYIEY